MSASISDGSVFGMSSCLAILGCLGRSLGQAQASAKSDDFGNSIWVHPSFWRKAEVRHPMRYAKGLPITTIGCIHSLIFPDGVVGKFLHVLRECLRSLDDNPEALASWHIRGQI